MQFQEFSISIVKSLPIRTHTKDSYSSMLRVHINPKIGCMKLEKISRKNVKDLLVGLRPQTAALVLSVVKMIFREAIEIDLIDKSPVHGLKSPSILVKPRKFFTWDELKKSSRSYEDSLSLNTRSR